jgi:hypothetical protein
VLRFGTNGVWLDGNTVAHEATDVMQSMQFAKLRDAYCWQSILSFSVRLVPFLI